MAELVFNAVNVAAIKQLPGSLDDYWLGKLEDFYPVFCKLGGTIYVPKGNQLIKVNSITDDYTITYELFTSYDGEWIPIQYKMSLYDDSFVIYKKP